MTTSFRFLFFFIIFLITTVFTYVKETSNLKKDFLKISFFIDKHDAICYVGFLEGDKVFNKIRRNEILIDHSYFNTQKDNELLIDSNNIYMEAGPFDPSKIKKKSYFVEKNENLDTNLKKIDDVHNRLNNLFITEHICRSRRIQETDLPDMNLVDFSNKESKFENGIFLNENGKKNVFCGTKVISTNCRSSPVTRLDENIDMAITNKVRMFKITLYLLVFYILIEIFLILKKTLLRKISHREG